MRVFPSIIQHGNDQSLQSIDLPKIQKKYSMASYETMITPNNNNINVTLSTPPPPLLLTQYRIQKQIKQCRICLQTSEQNVAELIKLCKCMGSVQFVHPQCFISWVQKSLTIKNKEQRNKILRKKQIQCQMCKDKVGVKFQNQWGLGKWQQNKKNIKDKPRLFGFILFLFIATLSSMIYLIQKVATQGLHLNKQSSKFFDSLFSVCSIVLLIVLNFISGFFIIQQFLIHSTLKVHLNLQTHRDDQALVAIDTKSIRKKSKKFIQRIQQQMNPQSPLHISSLLQNKNNSSFSALVSPISPNKLISKQRRNSRYQRAQQLQLNNQNNNYIRQQRSSISQLSQNNNKGLAMIENGYHHKRSRKNTHEYDSSMNSINGNSLNLNLQQILVSDDLIQEIIQ